MTQSQEDVVKLFSVYLFFLIPLSFFCKRYVPAPRRPQRRQCGLHIFPFLNSLFTFLVSPSPMLLFLHSQVASRVRAGFVGAHARKRDSATDLIAEKRRQEEEKQRAMETEMMQREM